MIQQACFEKQWIEDFKRQSAYRRINPPLLEKMIHALSLLQHLSKQSLRFVFKGGTSLVLLLDRPNRFSVDIDIMTTASRAEIEAALDGVVANSHFKSWTLDEVRSYKPGIPKAHYELSFASHYNFEVSYILLDVLYGEHQYPETTLLPITSTWVSTLDLVQVQMPTIDAITGDKLTAFAPNTTGIKYGVGKEQEIVKQLFDLGHLFDKMDSLAVVGQSFRAFAAQEIRYRQLPIDADAVLQDIVATCRTLALRERNVTQPELGNF
jgi:Nucleotidyl transferase AbiEii toxin, Type IV TA system